MRSQPTAPLSGLLLGFASCFERSAVSGRREPWEVPALLAIVLLGAVVRFWGIGTWGLELDEETMAMPTMHIVRHGSPVLPSGMTYVRGIGQLYLMAASVRAFGESEWAFRFPSAICGLVLIVIAYFVGRRFLGSISNIGLVAAVAFLPGFIADSQEARMYIFMLTCLAGYAVLVFEWEKSGSLSYLIGAVLVMIVGLQFHVLTVFGAFVVLLPGLLQGDQRKLWQGLAAFCCIAVAYFAISSWVASFYPPSPVQHGVGAMLAQSAGRVGGVRMPSWALLAAVPAAIALSVYVARGLRPYGVSAAVGAVVLLGLAAQLAFWNHVGLLLLALGAVLVSRQGAATLPRLLPLAAFSLVIVAFEFHLLSVAAIGSGRKIIGAMVGLPSIWPALQVAGYSPMAALIVTAGAARAVWQLAHGRRIADYWLFLVLAVWAPLLTIGLFSWYVEPRYTEFALLPMLVGAFALTQAFDWGRVARSGLVASICLVVVNPLASARMINAGYSIHPDHKGAADFVRSIRLGPRDLLLAEDVNQQTYYLGHVDYWLIGQETADHFSQRVNGEVRDIYTGTRILSTVDQLDALLRDPDRGAIYLIGSGEQQEDGRRFARGAGLDDALHSPLWEVIYSGRDGLTKVWRFRSRQQGESPSSGN